MESGEHMPDKEAFLKELLRVTMPGGRIIIVTWCHRELLPGETSLTGKIYNNFWFKLCRFHGNIHIILQQRRRDYLRESTRYTTFLLGYRPHDTLISQIVWDSKTFVQLTGQIMSYPFGPQVRLDRLFYFTWQI